MSIKIIRMEIKMIPQKELQDIAEKFWSAPSFKEPNLQGELITYTPSQVAMNNRKRAGLYCFREGYGQGYAKGFNDRDREILSLTKALDWATGGWKTGSVLGIDNMKKMLEIRKKFNLDERNHI
jgi:hypothetical protein